MKRKKGSSGLLRQNGKNGKLPAILLFMFAVLPAFFLFVGYKAGYDIGTSPVYSDKRPDLVNRILDPRYKAKYENRFQAYENQMTTLGGVQKSLNDLKIFIANHETKLKSEQDALEHILKQKQTLKPLLSADQEVVDALFKIQTDKNRTQKRVDLIIGFAVGIIASLIAAIIFHLIQKYYIGLNTDKTL